MRIALMLDTRRVKKDGRYLVKLLVYHYKKKVLYTTVHDMTEAAYGAFRSNRKEPRDAAWTRLLKMEELAIAAANRIQPFRTDQFYLDFIYGHAEFVLRKWTVILLPVPPTYSRQDPKEWLAKFPILLEDHPWHDAISVVFAGIVRSLVLQARISTAGSYQSGYYSFKLFRGNIRLREVTVQYLKEYEAWMIHERELSKTTVGIYTRNMRAVFNEAIELELIDRKAYPFGRRRYGVPTGRNIKKAMEPAMIAKLYYADPADASQEMARDFWFFSFYANGMNVKDMVHLKWKSMQGDFMVFERAKTVLTSRGGEPIIISCYITDDMRRILDKYATTDRSINNYVFRIMERGLSPVRQQRVKDNFVQFMNKNLARLTIDINIHQKVRTNEARHSASTILKNAGVPAHYIKEALGHASLKTTEYYLAGFQDDQKKEFSNLLSGFKKKEGIEPSRKT